VIQKGNLFQRKHPEIPVILDKGRFLLVEMHPEEAQRLSGGHAPCYSIHPYEHGIRRRGAESLTLLGKLSPIPTPARRERGQVTRPTASGTYQRRCHWLGRACRVGTRSRADISCYCGLRSLAQRSFFRSMPRRRANPAQHAHVPRVVTPGGACPRGRTGDNG
jgi:hypothetical protein